jgi:hypothetical protein
VKTDKDFVNDFVESYTAVRKVASWLVRQGFPNVKILPPMLRPEVSERAKYSDHGDIEFTRQVEVKHRIGRYCHKEHQSGCKLNFTCMEDFPFATIFVDDVNNVDERMGNVWSWIVVNCPETHIAVLQVKYHDRWMKKPDVWDERSQKFSTMYECPLDLAVFFELPK